MAFNEFEILNTIIDRIPLLNIGGKDYKTVFEFGSHEDLMKFLELKRRTKGNTYPLIWLTTPYKVSRDRAKIGGAPTNLIIANLSNQDMLNKERLETSFKLVLYPILDALLSELKYSKTTSYNEYETTSHFNYQPAEKEGSDIWDVIQLELDVTYKPNCLI